MSTVAKVIELTSSSPKSIEDAVETGIKRADQGMYLAKRSGKNRVLAA